MSDVIRVACSCDGEARYAAHSAAMLHSVLIHGDGRAVDIHYLTGEGFPDEAAAGLAAMVADHGGSISFVTVPDALVAGLRTTDDLPAASWYRIFLPELLPDVERVIYLDTDVIVMDSLAPLWDTDLRDHWVGAVANVFMRLHMGREAWLGMRQGTAYFNGGVMLVGLEQWRRDGCTTLMREAAMARPEKMGWADQDAMNFVLASRRLPLHPRWNCTNALMRFDWSADLFGQDAVDEARRWPAVRHFEGPGANKPWHYLCDHALREAYFEHRRGTPWPHVELEGRTPRNVLKRMVRRPRPPRDARMRRSATVRPR